MQDIGDDRAKRRAIRCRAAQRPRAAQRHMFPRPSILALVAREAFEADRDRPLCAAGPQTDVDFVKRARRSRRGKRGNHPLGKAVVIERAAERAGASGFASVIAAEQEHQIEV